uniref:Serine carboxypeptidase-like n=1 Tax=Oryza brachyantha TaxID=4533 RepID=J3N880_ORYBR
MMVTTTVTSTSCGGGHCRWWSWLPLACFLLLSWLAAISPAATVAGRAVTSLPGFDGPLPFSLETGYVEVDESMGIRLFYYFVQSENDPDNDPLMVWLLGGPGCSGLNGIVQEIGPFQFATKWQYRGGVPRLIYRPETWTKFSNIIFVDSPVGTGFSYADREEGFKSSDSKAVKQLLISCESGFRIIQGSQQILSILVVNPTVVP